MEELYLIMRDFLEVEYNQESLLYLLEAAEAAYSGEKREAAEETKWIVNSVKFYSEALREELKIAIHRLDCYITEKAKQ